IETVTEVTAARDEEPALAPNNFERVDGRDQLEVLGQLVGQLASKLLAVLVSLPLKLRPLLRHRSATRLRRRSRLRRCRFHRHPCYGRAGTLGRTLRPPRRPLRNQLRPRARPSWSCPRPPRQQLSRYVPPTAARPAPR